MATFDSKEFVDKIVAANGVLYPEDPNEPPIVKIVEYTNQWGDVTWGVLFEGDNPTRYEASRWVLNPRTYWVRKS